MRTFLLVFLALIFGFTSDEWQRVVDEDFGFSVDLPATAQKKDETLQIDGGIVLDKREYMVAIDAGSYLVSCARYPRLYFEVVDPNEFLDAAIVRTGWEVMSAQTVSVNGNPGRVYRVKITPDSPVSHHAMYVVKNRVFQLGAIKYPWADPDTVIDGERFIASFRLIK